MEYLKIAVDAPLQETLTYKNPDLDVEIKPGQRVSVPLGKGGRSVKGVVVERDNKPEGFLPKDILSIEEEILIPEKHLNWLCWLAQYYLHPIGQVLNLAFPPLKKQLKVRKSTKRNILPDYKLTSPPDLTHEQKQCLTEIGHSKKFSSHLLFGVTGSGKTEIYIRLIEGCLAQGKQAIFLVPEISLTPQLLNRFLQRFGDKIAVIHSQLTGREKTNQWWDMVSQKKPILMGARSALFCPLKNLGLIILDEEHESSYKQDEKLKYHARDAAVKLAQLYDIPIILGSATPSLETWNNVLQKKYKMHQLKNRVHNRAKPEISVVDLREERKQQKEQGIETEQAFWMSDSLFLALKENLKKGEQSALFLNRRGMAQSVTCQACGTVNECPNCNISLTLHANTHLICHYCDYHENFKETCKKCGAEEATPLGLGTELIEKDLLRLFPNCRVSRADRDEIQSREQMEDLVSAMEKGEIDILVGTQMIAKGLDFPKLTLVSLILADVNFNIPDFRAGEKSFQLITQVAGRAGRHEKPGRVILQTYNPEHPSILFSQNYNFDGFAKLALEERLDYSYSPFGKMALLKSQSLDKNKSKQLIDICWQRAQELKSVNQLEEIEVLGPVQASVFKVRNKYRYHLLIKAKHNSVLNKFVKLLCQNQKKWLPKGTKLIADMDPYGMM